MLRDITLGQYYPADSVVHKLDPRVKLFATLIYIIALFTFRGILGLALITGMLIFMIKISKVPLKFIVKGLKAIVEIRVAIDTTTELEESAILVILNALSSTVD